MFTGDGTAVDGFIICKKKMFIKMFIKLQGKDQQRFHIPDVEFVPPVEGQKKQESQLRLEATKVKS